MKNILFSIFATAALLASCTSSYVIKGKSDVPMLDGHKLTLKVVKDNELKNIDSCEVVHGEFQFAGSVDSTKVGAIYMNDESLLPVVLEEGDIVITINESHQSCTGSPLNDRLSQFIEKFNQISNQLADLEHQHYQAIMNGEDMEVKAAELQAKAEELTLSEEKLVTTFIEENFDNVLGPFAFRLITADMQVPMLDSWIQALMSKATDTFKNDAYVKEFMTMAEKNQNIMNGMEEQAPQVPVDAPLPNVPTPNQMAGE